MEYTFTDFFQSRRRLLFGRKIVEPNEKVSGLKDRGVHFGLGGAKSNIEVEGSGGEAPRKNSMTTPSTLAINATNAPFHRQTRIGKDSYHQLIQSLNHL